MNNLTPKTTQKGVFNFIGLVNYYCNMWERHSHTLENPNNLTSNKVKFKWTDVNQKAFKEIDWIVNHSQLLVYPDPNKRFEIHTDNSDLHLGAVIIQESKPIYLYSKKLTKPQKVIQ